ncbi:MAG: PilZ domain-containing protein [Candidatus Omnitrophica bacterium]|nr:PilZ domain-containing protein [Candidatus Omnitrophota bacterium]
MKPKKDSKIKKRKRKDENNQIVGVKAPDRVQIIEHRHFIRHPLSLPLVYRVVKQAKDQSRQDLRSETINVSIGGLLFPAVHPVEPNAMIEIKMPFENKVFNFKAKVVRCVHNSETKLYDIAVSFFRLREAFKAKMIEQIYLISEYRDLLSLQLGKEVSLEEASRKWIKRYSDRFERLYW